MVLTRLCSKCVGAMCFWMCAWRLNLLCVSLGGGGISMEAALLRLSTNAHVAHRWESLWPCEVFEMRAAIGPYSSRVFISWLCCSFHSRLVLWAVRAHAASAISLIGVKLIMPIWSRQKAVFLGRALWGRCIMVSMACFSILSVWEGGCTVGGCTTALGRL